MKTVVQILIIWFTFILFATLMVTVVNTSGVNSPNFSPGGDSQPEFRPQDGGRDNQPFQPEEGRGERGGSGVIRLLFGMIANVGLIAVLVTAIVWPKSIARKKRKALLISSAVRESK